MLDQKCIHVASSHKNPIMLRRIHTHTHTTAAAAGPTHSTDVLRYKYYTALLSDLTHTVRLL